VSLIGQNLGQYLIVEFIGAGGMASVYKAYQPSLDRYVAVKVLPAQHALTPGYKERFILEARAVAQLSHPNILPIYDFGLEGDLSYFVMKYVPDRTLGDLMGKPLDLAQVSHYVDQVAGALDHAHARGILHRDVKPANMLLEGDWLLLTDFGLAKITEATTAITSTGHIFGTPAYVSPEQAEGSPLDHRTDIYSLGIVLYQMVLGRVPFEGTTAMRIINKHIYEPPPPPRSLRPDLPEPIEQVMLKALAKKPADRYDHPGDLAQAFREALEVVSAQTVPASVASTQPQQQVAEPARATPQSSDRAGAAVPGLVAEVNPSPAEKAASPEPQPIRAAKPARSVLSTSSLGLLGGALLLVVVSVLIFFTGKEAVGETAAATATPGQATPTEINATTDPTRTATATATPTPAPTTPQPDLTPQAAGEVSTPTSPSAPATETVAPAEVTAPATPSIEPMTPTPQPGPSIGGTLAIPVKVGAEFKVYVTGFDGAGINGPAPVSLGNARQPMFRRDGQAIVVNGAADGALRGIFVTDSRGGGPNPLNDRGQAYWPVWSPDGSEIMFVDWDQGRTVFRQSSQLARSEADYVAVQANSVNLVGNNLVWSDDNHLIFQGCADWLGQAGECGIWAADAATVDPIRLTANGGLPTDAKNGLLTYMLAEDGDWEIYLLPLAGGQPLNLTNNSYQDGLAAIAPDGQSVAYVSDESGVWAVWTITLGDNQKQKWFDLDPQRGTIDVNIWAEERMSWTP
jgi:serine/threonine protein kinase